MKINSALCFAPADLAHALNTAKDENDTLTYEIAQALAYRLFFERYLGWKNIVFILSPRK